MPIDINSVQWDDDQQAGPSPTKPRLNASTIQWDDGDRAGNIADAVIEPLTAVAGGLANQAISGIAGVATLPFGADKAANVVRKTQQALPDYSPSTDAGRRGMNALSSLVQYGTDAVNYPVSGLSGLAELATGGGIDRAASTVRDVQKSGFGETAGERVFEETGNPLAAMAAQISPDVAGAVLGSQAAKAAGRVAVEQAKKVPGAITAMRAPPTLIDAATGYPTKPFAKALQSRGMTYENIINDIPNLPASGNPQKAIDALIAQKIKAGDTDDFLASKRLDDAGAVVDDNMAKEAIRQGLREGDIQALKAASYGTKQKMKEMLKIRRQTHGNERLGLEQRPSDVIGDAVLSRFTTIRDAANRARDDLDSIATTKLPGLPINARGVADNFFDQLNKLDIKHGMAADGRPVVDFTGSMISKDRTSQRVIKDVIDLLAEPKAPDALRAHKLKRQLDAMIDYRKQSQGGLTESGRNLAKSVRASLNDAIRAVDPDYAAANDTLSRSLTAMNNFENTLGGSIDIWAPGAEKAIGQDLRGLLSNRKSRVKLENAVGDIDAAAKEMGGKFDDNIGDLVLFAKTLDDQFGASARSSLAGEMEAATSRTAKRMMQGQSGLKDMAMDYGIEKVNKMRNINDQQAFRVLHELLSRDKPPPSAGLPSIRRTP